MRIGNGGLERERTVGIIGGIQMGENGAGIPTHISIILSFQRGIGITIHGIHGMTVGKESPPNVPLSPRHLLLFLGGKHCYGIGQDQYL